MPEKSRAGVLKISLGQGVPWGKGVLQETESSAERNRNCRDQQLVEELFTFGFKSQAGVCRQPCSWGVGLYGRMVLLQQGSHGGGELEMLSKVLGSAHRTAPGNL